MKQTKVKVTVAVFARRFVPDTTRTEDFTFSDTVTGHVNNKYSLLMACRKEFGRCKGSIIEGGVQTGWRFEGKEKDSGGSVNWWETQVLFAEGFEKSTTYKTVAGR